MPVFTFISTGYHSSSVSCHATKISATTTGCGKSMGGVTISRGPSRLLHRSQRSAGDLVAAGSALKISLSRPLHGQTSVRSQCFVGNIRLNPGPGVKNPGSSGQGAAFSSLLEVTCRAAPARWCSDIDDNKSETPKPGRFERIKRRIGLPGSTFLGG